MLGGAGRCDGKRLKGGGVGGVCVCVCADVVHTCYVVSDAVRVS